MRRLKILLFSANPTGTSELELQEEVRAVRRQIRAADYRDAIDLEAAGAVRPDDLLQLLNERRPHVIHFSGHSNDAGELLLRGEAGEPQAVEAEAIEDLFRAIKGDVRLVVLSFCASRSLAKAIARVVDCAIGMDGPADDRAAMLFAASLYRAIGFGCSVGAAFDQARVALALEGLRGDARPTLFRRRGVDPWLCYLLEPDVALVSGFIDHPPLPGARLAGAVRLRGWAASAGRPIRRVDVFIDNVHRGSAIYGTPRPDAGGDVGFFWDWDTHRDVDGGHRVEVRTVLADGTIVPLPSAADNALSISFDVANGKQA